MSFECTGKCSGIDKKEVAVWKLPEDVTKIQYRHWSNAVDIQLEAVHSWSCADYVLNRVKRCTDPMDPFTFKRCLEEASADISGDPDVHMLAPTEHEYPFAERIPFLYTYLLGKSSTDLYDRVSSIEGKNGFDVDRQAAQMIDAVPENAEFLECRALATCEHPRAEGTRPQVVVRLQAPSEEAQC